MAIGARPWFLSSSSGALATAVLVGMFVLRLGFLGLPELIPEEAYYWLYSQHLSPGYLDHPPMVGWLIALGTGVFGHNEFGVRIGALLTWSVAAFFLFRLGCELFDRERAWLAVALFSILPIFAGIGFTIAPDSPLFAAWSAALYFLYRAAIENRAGAWYWLGCAVGVGMLSKYTIVLIAPATLLVLILNRSSRHWLLKPQPYVAGLISVVIFSPVVFWNATHGWASFVFQGPRRFAMPTHFALHLFVLDMMMLVTPTALVASCVVLQEWWKERGRVLSDARLSARVIFVCCAALVPIAVFGTLSLRHVGKLNWSGPAFIPLLPCLADQIVSFSPGGAARWRVILHKSWRPTFVILAAAYLVVLTYLGPGIPFVGFSEKSKRFIGWGNMGQQIVALNDQIAAQTGERAIVVGMDKHNISSELAFYARAEGSRAAEQVVGRDSFGMESLMFRYWDREVSLEGKTLLLVARKESELRGEAITRWFRSVDAPKEIVTTRHGKRVGRYVYRIGRQFRDGGREVE